MKMTLPSQIIMAIPLQSPLPRSQRKRINCNCTEEIEPQNMTTHEIVHELGSPSHVFLPSEDHRVKLSINRNKNKAKL